jgi:hypothetical protein
MSASGNGLHTLGAGILAGGIVALSLGAFLIEGVGDIGLVLAGKEPAQPIGLISAGELLWWRYGYCIWFVAYGCISLGLTLANPGSQQYKRRHLINDCVEALVGFVVLAFLGFIKKEFWEYSSEHLRVANIAIFLAIAIIVLLSLRRYNAPAPDEVIAARLMGLAASAIGIAASLFVPVEPGAFAVSLLLLPPLYAAIIIYAKARI